MTKKHFLIDMDGVKVQGKSLISGVGTFIEELKVQKRKFLLLTSNPVSKPRDLSHRLELSGLNIPPKIEETSGVAPYFIGKPNPLMMRTALNYLGAHS